MTCATPYASASASEAGLSLERVIILLRHGIRSPLPGEAPLVPGADPWPVWDTNPGELTKRGFAGAKLLAENFRDDWIQRGLLPNLECAAAGSIYLRANSLPRTIDSARAFADSMSPECPLPVEHKPVGTLDSLFSSIAAGSTDFDFDAAVANLKTALPPLSTMIRRREVEFRLLGQVLGCERRSFPCDVSAEFGTPHLEPAANGISVGGAIEAGAGGAQTILLQYVEGFPPEQVGWGRANTRTLKRLSSLHALPLIVQSRLPYMARRISKPWLEQLVNRLQPTETVKVAAYVGHDNNISAVAAALGLDFKMPGYARNDPPIGSGLVFELLRSDRTGEQYIRTVYIAQTPAQLRNLTPLKDGSEPARSILSIAACPVAQRKLCKLSEFLRALEAI